MPLALKTMLLPARFRVTIGAGTEMLLVPKKAVPPVLVPIFAFSGNDIHGIELHREMTKLSRAPSAAHSVEATT